MTGKDVLPEKDLLGNAVTMKRFKYSLIGKELKVQTNIGKKQYKELDRALISNRDNTNVNESLIKKENKKFIISQSKLQQTQFLQL